MSGRVQCNMCENELPSSVDVTQQNADVTWQELQGIADRVRLLKRIVGRLSNNIQVLQQRSQKNRKESISCLTEK